MCEQFRMELLVGAMLRCGRGKIIVNVLVGIWLTAYCLQAVEWRIGNELSVGIWQAAGAPDGNAPGAPKPAPGTTAPPFLRHPQRDTPWLVQNLCEVRLCLVCCCLVVRGAWRSLSPQGQCVGVTPFCLRCISNLLRWGDSRDIAQHWWVSTVRKKETSSPLAQ